MPINLAGPQCVSILFFSNLKASFFFIQQILILTHYLSQHIVSNDV